MNSLTTKNPASLTRPSRYAGFSLIEMMISITIGLLIVAALVGVLVSNSTSSKSNDRTAELQSNGRFALSHLQTEIRLGGYRGYTPRAPESAAWTTPTITGECGTAGSFVKNIRQGVWGSNDSNPFSANCITSGYNTVNSDVIVVRHADNIPILAASAVSNTVYLRTSYSNASVMQGSALPTATPTGTENFALREYVYFIGQGDCVGGGTASVPALCRKALNGNSMDTELVVSGIEQMQLQYGIANGSDIQYFDAGGISGGHSDTGATDWDKVIAVRLWLLARNSTTESGYTNDTTYNMGSSNYGPINDNFRRQLFTSVVHLRNFRD